MYIVISKKVLVLRQNVECGNLLPLLQFFGVRGLLLPHITSAAAALTTVGRTDGPSFPLSFFHCAVGSSGLETFLVAAGSLGCFPRSKKEGRGSEKRKLMLSAREPGRIYLERKREDLVRATTRHGSPVDLSATSRPPSSQCNMDLSASEPKKTPCPSPMRAMSINKKN